MCGHKNTSCVCACWFVSEITTRSYFICTYNLHRHRHTRRHSIANWNLFQQYHSAFLSFVLLIFVALVHHSPLTIQKKRRRGTRRAIVATINFPLASLRLDIETFAKECTTGMHIISGVCVYVLQRCKRAKKMQLNCVQKPTIIGPTQKDHLIG